MDGVAVLTVTGLLDCTTYMKVRSAVVKAAADEPVALIVDVTDLAVPVGSAWAVFTSAHWQINAWREVPMVLVCEHQAGHDEIRRNGLNRYLRLYSSLTEALVSVPRSAGPIRRRARAELQSGPASVNHAQHLVTEWLTQWSLFEFVAAATTVVTVFMEDVIGNTCGATVQLRLETNGTNLTVAVDDANPAPADLCDNAEALPGVSGLELVRVLSRAWGNTPTDSGKTVWAVIGPADRVHQ